MSSQLIEPKYYTATLPSDQKKIQFRAFVVKEEKALLLSLQENTLDDIAGSIKSLLTACTNGEFKADERPYYDSEYLFLKIRSKSIGEIIDLIGKCECSEEAKTQFIVDIEQDLRIDPPVKELQTFSIPDSDISLKFRHPSIDNFLELNDQEDNSEAILAKCITEVYNTDEILDLTLEKKVELLDSMTSKQQKELKTFLSEMPMVKLDAKYKCRACGKQHEQVLTGFENFFV